MRIRGLAARTFVPGFAVPDGFEKETIQSFALLGDYFFTPAFKNLWAGGGVEYWKGGVTNSDDLARSNFKDIILTAGAGYIIKIWQGIYINPGVAIHLIVSGDRAVETGSRIFNTNTITPELSLKIGYHYRL